MSAPASGDPYAAAQTHLDRLESAMRDSHLWPGAPPPGPLEIKGAFGCQSMTFEQWLAWVFIPRVRQIISHRADFPNASQVSTYAVREFDGRPECDDVIAALSDIDDLVNGLHQ